MKGICGNPTKFVAMAASIEILEKEIQIDHLHP